MSRSSAPKWEQYGLCRGEDPELFFPVGDSGPARLQEAQAKVVCKPCPVAGFCLQKAIDNGQQGVAGRHTERERRDLKARNLVEDTAALYNLEAPPELLRTFSPIKNQVEISFPAEPEAQVAVPQQLNQEQPAAQTQQAA